VLGLGSRDQHGRRDDQIHAPEFLVTCNVLRGNAADSLRQRDFVASRFLGSQVTLRVRVQVSAVAPEYERQEKLRIHAGRRDIVGGETSERLSEGLLQLHKSISPQSASDEDENMDYRQGTKKRTVENLLTKRGLVRLSVD
jgi:hypothetical protein